MTRQNTHYSAASLFRSFWSWWCACPRFSFPEEFWIHRILFLTAVAFRCIRRMETISWGECYGFGIRHNEFQLLWKPRDVNTLGKLLPQLRLCAKDFAPNINDYHFRITITIKIHPYFDHFLLHFQFMRTGINVIYIDSVFFSLDSPYSFTNFDYTKLNMHHQLHQYFGGKIRPRPMHYLHIAHQNDVINSSEASTDLKR